MRRVSRQNTIWRRSTEQGRYNWDRLARRRLGQQSSTGGSSVLWPCMPVSTKMIGKVRM